MRVLAFVLCLLFPSVLLAAEPHPVVGAHVACVDRDVAVALYQAIAEQSALDDPRVRTMCQLRPQGIDLQKLDDFEDVEVRVVGVLVADPDGDLLGLWSVSVKGQENVLYVIGFVQKKVHDQKYRPT